MTAKPNILYGTVYSTVTVGTSKASTGETRASYARVVCTLEVLRICILIYVLRATSFAQHREARLWKRKNESNRTFKQEFKEEESRDSKYSITDKADGDPCWNIRFIILI